MPGGQLLVAAVGVGVLVVAGFLVYGGWTEKLTSKLDSGALSPDRRTAIVRLGKAGYLAKGVALGIIGVLPRDREDR